MSPYSSSIMLIARNNSSLKSIITDFRFIRSRLQRVNLAFPLIRDAFSILEGSKYECLSVLDKKDTYHIIKLSEGFKAYCCILPYFAILEGSTCECLSVLDKKDTYHILKLSRRFQSLLWHTTLFCF